MLHTITVPVTKTICTLTSGNV